MYVYIFICAYKSAQMYIYMCIYESIQNILSTTCIPIHMFHRESGKRSNWALFKSYGIILVWKETYMII